MWSQKANKNINILRKNTQDFKSLRQILRDKNVYNDN